MKLEDCLVLFTDFLSPCQKLEQSKNRPKWLPLKLNFRIPKLIFFLTTPQPISTKSQQNVREKHAAFCSQLSGANEFELKDELWTFAVISMNLLESLNTAEFELNNNNCYLSIQNERLLNVLFQLAICFGIHYNLEDFIGNVLLIGHCIY